MGGVGVTLLRRLAAGLLTVWAVSIVTFGLAHLAPGDPVLAALGPDSGSYDMTAAQYQRLRSELGLDRSLPVQYLQWVGRLARLDAGQNPLTGRSVSDSLLPRFGATFELAALSLLISLVIGLAVGSVMAAFQGRWYGEAARFGAFLTMSMPGFWIGLLAVIACSSWLHFLPGGGYRSLLDDPAANLGALAPAALVLALRPGALLARLVASGTRESMWQPHFTAARARGAGFVRAFLRHGLRVGALPSMAVLGVEAVQVLGGAVIIERVFNIPGAGRALIDAAQARDYPSIQFIVMVLAGLAVAATILVDVGRSVLDPRVRSAQ